MLCTWFYQSASRVSLQDRYFLVPFCLSLLETCCIVSIFVLVPLLVVSPSLTGRHTIDRTGDYDNSNCGYGPLSGSFGPGNANGLALNDFDTSGVVGAVGYNGPSGAVGAKCGVCYQVTGIQSSLVVMVTNHCPDCQVLQPHFDMNPIPAGCNCLYCALA
jgi:hypothetical protein